jgi:hypothetical protein
MPDMSARMAAALGKYSGIYARLCLLFHLIEVADARANGDMGPPLYVVPETTAAKVLAYVRNCLLPHLGLADRIMYLTPQSGHARWIAGYILSRNFRRITRRDITRAYSSLRAPERERELTSVMNGLVTVDWVREEVSSNPARPPAAWSVNPKLWAKFKDRAEQEREARRQAAESLADKIRECARAREG